MKKIQWLMLGAMLISSAVFAGGGEEQANAQACDQAASVQRPDGKKEEKGRKSSRKRGAEEQPQSAAQAGACADEGSPTKRAAQAAAQAAADGSDTELESDSEEGKTEQTKQAEVGAAAPAAPAPCCEQQNQPSRLQAIRASMAATFRKMYGAIPFGHFGGPSGGSN